MESRLKIVSAALSAAALIALLTGCSTDPGKGNSTPTGTIAPSSAGMSVADRQERLRQVMPKGMPQAQAPGKH